MAYKQVAQDTFLPLWGDPAVIAAAVLGVVGPMLGAEVEKGEGWKTVFETARRAEARVRGLHERYAVGADDYCAHCNQIGGVWVL